MTFLAHRRLARFIAGVALLLTVGLLLTPARAQASCGDYVTVGESTDHVSPVAPSSAPDSSARRQGSSTPSVPVNVPGRHNNHGPCTGPTCSQHPAPLPPASAPATPERDRQTASAIMPGPVPVSSPCDALTEQVTLSFFRHTSEIYHPPR
jgi:hypothetical protein